MIPSPLARDLRIAVGLACQDEAPESRAHWLQVQSQLEALLACEEKQRQREHLAEELARITKEVTLLTRLETP